MSMPSLGVDIFHVERSNRLIAQTLTRPFSIIPRFLLNIDIASPNPAFAGDTLSDSVNSVLMHLKITGRQSDATILDTILKYFTYTISVNDPNTKRDSLVTIKASNVDVMDISDKISIAMKGKLIMGTNFSVSMTVPSLGVFVADKNSNTVLATTDSRPMTLSSLVPFNSFIMDVRVPDPKATGEWATKAVDNVFLNAKLCGKSSKETILNQILATFCFYTSVNDPADINFIVSNFSIPSIEIIQISNAVQLGFKIKPENPNNIKFSGQIPELGVDLTRDLTRAQTSNVLIKARSKPTVLGDTVSSVVQIDVPSTQGTGHLLTDLINAKRLKMYACGARGFTSVVHKVMEHFCFPIEMNEPKDPKKPVEKKDEQTTFKIKRVDFTGAEAVGKGYAGFDISIGLNKMYFHGKIPQFDFEAIVTPENAVVFKASFAALTLINNEKETTIKPHVLFQVPDSGGDILQKKINGLIEDLAGKTQKKLVTGFVRGAQPIAGANIISQVLYYTKYDLSPFFKNATSIKTETSGSESLNGLTKKLILKETTAGHATFTIALKIDNSPVDFPIFVGNVNVEVLSKPFSYKKPNFIRLATLSHANLQIAAESFTLNPILTADTSQTGAHENLKWTLHDLLMKPHFAHDVPLQVKFSFSHNTYKTFQFTWNGVNIPVTALDKTPSSGQSEAGIVCSSSNSIQVSGKTFTDIIRGRCSFKTSQSIKIKIPVVFDVYLNSLIADAYFEAPRIKKCVPVIDWPCLTLDAQDNNYLGHLRFNQGGDGLRMAGNDRTTPVTIPVDASPDFGDCARAMFLGDDLQTYLKTGTLCAGLKSSAGAIQWKACVQLTQDATSISSPPTPKC